MKIAFECPPMFEYINHRFHPGPRVIFTFGDTIYNPDRINVTKELQAHEQVHSDRQLAYAGGPACWWANYISWQEFILAEEAPAHRAEYLAYCKRHRGGGSQRIMCIAIANKLCSAMYGKVCTHEEAVRVVLGEWLPVFDFASIASPLPGVSIIPTVEDPTPFNVDQAEP